MAKAKTSYTLNGQALDTKHASGKYVVANQGWVKPPLSNNVNAAWDAIKAARKAFEDGFIKHVTSTVKVDQSKHALQFGFLYGPSYRVVDKACLAKSVTPGQGREVDFEINAA